MIPQTLTAIKAILESDTTVLDEERRLILSVCRSPRRPRAKRLCTTRQAAEILSCHVKTVLRYAKQGRLHPIYHSARKIRFDRDEIERFAVEGFDRQ